MTDLRTGGGIAATAFLMGDPARAAMLAALLGGRALTAGELAAEAGITAQTVSGHLVRLVEGGLVDVERQGRHRYVRLSSPAVAEALEGLMALAPPAPTGATRPPRGPRDEAMRLARTCYDHMAGRLAVAIADALERDGRLRLDEGAASSRRRAKPFSARSGSTSPGRPPRAGRSAGPASTGASGARISPAASAPRCSRARSISAGSPARRRAER